MAEDISKEDGLYLDSDNKTEDLEQVGNPAPPSDVDLDLLRGDRIGDTVYSGKWCIQTVMKILQSNVVMKPEEAEEKTDDGKSEVVDMEEDLQNEVGVLWDMTSNVEVCQYLQSVGAIESIYHVIANSRCPRATEMCVGMLANIVTHDELWQSLHSDSTLFAILIPLFISTDQPVLLELSRFFTTALSHSKNSNCYSSMFSYGPLMAQELVRILSGSTNCDLLKHAIEMTHILMCLDTDDNHFNALFADPDFIMAVLEASKEIGYDQESSSQSHVMEILHCFTTYQAGINAMETCMEQMTEAITKYLRLLCHNVNLSSNGEVVSVIITLLNHIFCRSLVVRIEVMSSPKLLQYILKILVVLYRRLGLYDSVAQSPQRHHHHHHRHHHHHHHRHHHQHDKHHHHRDKDNDKEAALKSTSGWESTTAEEEETKPAAKSWSERAGVGDSTPQHLFVTPDPSPKQSLAMKETEFLSWSERRIASPLVDGGEMVSHVWKMPHEKKAKKTKSKLATDESAGDDIEETLAEENSTDKYENEKSASSSSKEDNNENEVCHDEKSNTDASSSDDEDQKNDSLRMRRGTLDSCKSGGFSPSISDREEDEDESMELEHQHEKSELPSNSEELKENGDGGMSESKTLEYQESTFTNAEEQLHENKEMRSRNRKAVSVEEEGAAKIEINSEEKERETGMRVSNHSNLDKYHKLLNALREFLSDFFSNMREGLLTEQGVPVVSDVLAYLDTQCRSFSLRALVHSVGPSRDISTPIGRLIHLASCLEATNLHSVLLECTKEKD